MRTAVRADRLASGQHVQEGARMLVPDGGSATRWAMQRKVARDDFDGLDVGHDDFPQK
jgi:hypothetical protein